MPGLSDAQSQVLAKAHLHSLHAASLVAWQGEGRRGVWVKISLEQSELIPAAAKVGPHTATLHRATDYSASFLSL